MCASKQLPLSNSLTTELKREAGRERGIQTYVCLVDLILHWLYLQHSLAVLSNSLFPHHLDPNYILIRREWQSEDSITLTTQLPWKLPSFSFRITRDNLCVFCYTHFLNSFSFVFMCWPCTKKYNLTSCIFSAKKVSIPGLNVSCTQIKGKKHKS